MTVLLCACALSACSNNSAGTKHVGVNGKTSNISTDADNKHVAYLLGAMPNVGATGELHVATPDGTDTKIATGVAGGDFAVAPTGTGLLYELLSDNGMDASLWFVDLTTPGAQPKALFTSGIPVEPTTPGGSTNFPAPVNQVGFFTPSGKYFVLGVLPPNVSISADLHVIDMATGADVFTRPNGAFDYLELALPDDTMIFQDAVGNNTGPSAPPGVQTLFWVSLPAAGSSQPATIDVRTSSMQVSGDNKTLVYSRTDKGLFSWDVAAHPTSGTQIGSNALSFAVADHGPVAYVAGDGGVHVVNFDGSAVVDAAGAAADPFSPIFISADGSDVYFFQKVETQNTRGTLFHLAASAGATPAMLAEKASIADVHPVAGGLLYLANVDDLGQFGDEVFAQRDGSAAMMLGHGVPTGGLAVVTPKMMAMPWAAPHLTGATIDKMKTLPDFAPAIAGTLAVTVPGGSDVSLDTMTRIGQWSVADDLGTLTYVAGSTYDMDVNNYVGSLTRVDLPAAKDPKNVLDGVSEVGAVVGKTEFVNAPKAGTPGVYYVTY